MDFYMALSTVILFSLELMKYTILHELDMLNTSKNPCTDAKINWLIPTHSKQHRYNTQCIR